jgi:hypothetical protein
MRAAGYVMTDACAETLSIEVINKDYDRCVKGFEEAVPQHGEFYDWNRTCLQVQSTHFRTQRGNTECYQSDRWWLRWFSR